MHWRPLTRSEATRSAASRYQENGSYFISMEFMEGTPLDEILKQHGPIRPQVVARLATQIASGLDYAHLNKIIHRDIKTANLFFTKDRYHDIIYENGEFIALESQTIES